VAHEENVGQRANGSTRASRSREKQQVRRNCSSSKAPFTWTSGGGRSAFDDPALHEIARQHRKSPAQVMLRWHLQEGRSAIPKSTKPARIAENFDVFDFELSKEQLADIDTLETGVRRGPEPDSITLETYGREIPEA
jgi:diketogulonate reductase-like aldo/keto reductase